MGKLTAFVWMSLDGVVDAYNMSEWWDPYDSKERQAYIQKVYNNADAFVMGRNTYDFLAPAWSSMHNNEMGVAANFNAAPKYIATDSPLDIPWQNSIEIEGDVAEEIKKLKHKTDNVVLIGSAHLAQSLIAAGVIDEYRLLVQPAVVGVGERFFKDGTDASLKLIDVGNLAKGVLALHYGTA
jgi:dihydrofolate reductase